MAHNQDNVLCIFLHLFFVHLLFFFLIRIFLDERPKVVLDLNRLISSISEIVSEARLIFSTLYFFENTKFAIFFLNNINFFINTSN